MHFSLNGDHHKKYLVFGLIILGIVLRIPFTTLDPIFNVIAHSLNVPISSLGFLTTVPLIMFAICSFIIPSIAQKFELKSIFTYSLILMTLGSFIRLFNIVGLYIGTAFIGIAIAFLNVLLPAAVTEYFPNDVGKYTSVYVSAMTLSMTLCNSVVVPITNWLSWKGTIIILSFIILISLIYWFPSLKMKNLNMNMNNINVNNDSEFISIKKIWTNKRAWILLIFSGLQSFIFYVFLTWLPTIMIEYGVSPSTAGIISGIYSLIGLPFSIFLPAMVVKMKKNIRKIMLMFLCILLVLGSIMLFYKTSNLCYWCIIVLFLGCPLGALYPYEMTIFSEKASSSKASASITGMAQTGGYVLAAIGPVVFGYCFNVNYLFAIILVTIIGIMMSISLWMIEKYKVIL